MLMSNKSRISSYEECMLQMYESSHSFMLKCVKLRDAHHLCGKFPLQPVVRGHLAERYISMLLSARKYGDVLP